ncbi:hypothetical protein [Methyloglobulus sp.]|uniref:hypothetical protein n=1 Tax=Methyloglobulus sp. TaxID=2518622 RepID=UPI0032B77687
MNLNNAARTAIRRNARWLLRLTALVHGIHPTRLMRLSLEFDHHSIRPRLFLF